MDAIEVKELFQGQANRLKLVHSFISSMSVKCAVELGIADVIHSHGRPITLSELVSALNIQPNKTGNLFRFMRLLIQIGLFSKTKLHNHSHNQQQEESYGLTPASTLLIKDKSYCMSPFVSGMLDPDFVTLFHSLSSWFKGNDLTLTQTDHGMNIYGSKPRFGQRFNDAKASDSQIANLVVNDLKPIFHGLGSLVDVGGGNGSFSRIISEANSDVLDLAHAVANMPRTDNLKYIAGDIFQFIPPADAFLFQEDEQELTEIKLSFDTLMDFFTDGGKERTEKEWESLFLDAGFSHYKITPILGLKSIIDVYP